MGESPPLRKKGSREMKYRFEARKYYEVEAPTYDEALALLNSEKEYNYLVQEEWEILEGQGV